MKKMIDVFDYAGDICKAMKKGILLTARDSDRVNTMTIGWGMIGIEWGKPIFIALVRESRYTKQFLDNSGEFSVNIPYGEVNSQILGFCGTKSGRDVDKIGELGLTLEEPVSIAAPGIRELPLTLECKVIFKQLQEESVLPEGLYQRYYPADSQNSDFRDYHTAYYGEIVNAYLITD